MWAGVPDSGRGVVSCGEGGGVILFVVTTAAGFMLLGYAVGMSRRTSNDS
ncbi:MAG: hypothetical protein M3430_03690 [Acidobacteriota bacterium]|nr:hypothetical protein [Acidobacteriota bacterium]